ISVDGVHDQRALHRNETAHAGIRALQLLHDQAVLGMAQAGAAVAFQVGAQKPQFRHLRHNLRRETPVAVAIANQWQYPFLGEPPRGLPHHQLLFTEERVDAEVVYAPKCHDDFFPTYLNTARAGHAANMPGPLLQSEPRPLGSGILTTLPTL